MTKLKIIRYSGSKIKYVEHINKLANSSNMDTYVEPFLGSGAVFLNLTKKFDRHIISDVDRNIVRIFKTMQCISFEDFINLYTSVTKTFGKINQKEGYYSFREWFNKTHWKKDTVEEGVYLIMLANSCINSMMRFSDDGFNQGCGMRDFTIAHNKVVHEKIREKLAGVEILHSSFFDLTIPDKSLIFVDPPYFYRPNYSYVGFDKPQYDKFINFLKTTKNHVLYTDIMHSDLEWNFQPLREDMKTTSPLKKSESTGNQEVVYFNFNCAQKPLF